MTFIDIHSHVQFAAYDADLPAGRQGREAVMARAREQGTKMINVGTQFDTSKAAVELAHKYPDIAWATIGLHPVHTSKSYHDTKEIGEGGEEFTSRGEVFDYDKYLELGRDEKVVAIGECGLDYYRVVERDSLFVIRQKEIFRQHVKLALELDKPLMIHCRDAYEDLLEILNEQRKTNNKKRLRGNVHFFAGGWDIAQQFLKRGFTLSFTGVITFTHDYDEVVKNTPLDMIMSQTDSPYITPIPLRGKRNEPINVKYVVQRIAEIKQLPVEQVAEQIMENAKRVFKVNRDSGILK